MSLFTEIKTLTFRKVAKVAISRKFWGTVMGTQALDALPPETAAKAKGLAWIAYVLVEGLNSVVSKIKGGPSGPVNS
jgi:hypothetical protein